MKELQKVINNIADLNNKLMDDAQKRLDNLTKPLGSLGRLEELAKQIVGITGRENPSIKNKVIFTLAADHGITEEGVSAYPKEVTAQMVYNFLRGGAAINVLSRHVGAKVVVVDMGVSEDLKPDANLIIKKINYGTKNMAKGPAMSREEAVRSIESGIDIFEKEYAKGVDIIGIGEMGIGNTTSSTAIIHIFTGKAIEDIAGKGAGLDDKGLDNKIRIIKKVLEVNKPDPKDAIEVLSKVGGFEIGGLVGIVLAASSRRIPVVIDGVISGSAALIAYQLEPKTKNYMISSHCSVERGHRITLDYIGLKPLFDLNMRLGEGTGATLVINLAEASIKILTDMATFKSANVSERSS